MSHFHRLLPRRPQVPRPPRRQRHLRHSVALPRFASQLWEGLAAVHVLLPRSCLRNPPPPKKKSRSLRALSSKIQKISYGEHPHGMAMVQTCSKLKCPSGRMMKNSGPPLLEPHPNELSPRCLVLDLSELHFSPMILQSTFHTSQPLVDLRRPPFVFKNVWGGKALRLWVKD